MDAEALAEPAAPSLSTDQEAPPESVAGAMTAVLPAASETASAAITSECIDEEYFAIDILPTDSQPGAEPAAVALPPLPLATASYAAPDLNTQVIRYARFAVPTALAEGPFGAIYAPAWPTWLAALELRQRTGCPLVLHLPAWPPAASRRYGRRLARRNSAPSPASGPTWCSPKLTP